MGFLRDCWYSSRGGTPESRYEDFDPYDHLVNQDEIEEYESMDEDGKEVFRQFVLNELRNEENARTMNRITNVAIGAGLIYAMGRTLKKFSR